MRPRNKSGSDHKFYPPKNQGSNRKKQKTVRVAPGGKPRKVGENRAASAYGEWSTLMKEMPPDSKPRPYNISEMYDTAEFLEHPVFGTGRVLGVVGREKIEVAFQDGRKVLLCNRKKSIAE